MSKFSIVIPVYNEIAYTIKTLESIKRNSSDYEIVFVDDASTDGTSGYLDSLKSSNIKVIHHKKRKGFTLSSNDGIKESSNEYIVLLNNDVLVPQDWLLLLENTFRSASRLLNVNKIGFVGPVSNYVAGTQLRKIKEFTLDESNFEPFANAWSRDKLQLLYPAAFLSGFCLFSHRSVLEDVGLFDERFGEEGRSGFEDNQLIIRGYLKGYYSVVSEGTYVYHFGHKSSSLPELRYIKNGLVNRDIYYEWWDKEERFKSSELIIGYRIKNGKRWIKDSITKSLEVADKIVILMDNPEDGTDKIVYDLQKKHRDKIVDVRLYKREFNEYRDRQEVLDMAYKVATKERPWFMNIDADEILEERIDRKVIEKLMYPPEPSALSYIFKFATFWRGRELIRIDGTMGRMANILMGRMLPDMKLRPGTSIGLHSSRLPLYPKDGASPTSYRFLHYGFEDYELAKKKFKWITDKDKEINPILVGGKDYTHIIDERNLRVVPFQPKPTLGLTTIMKNEEDLVDEYMKNYWSFFDKIIIGVDSRTVDKTESKLKRWGAKTYKFIYNDSLAEARNKILEKVDTKYVMHIDCDEKVPNLFDIVRLIELGYDGYMFPIHNIHKTGVSSVTEGVRLFRNLDWMRYEGRVHETLERAIIKNKGKIVKTPNIILHLGYLRSEGYLTVKLNNYEYLNKLMIKDNPSDPRPYFNLALHYLNEGHAKKAEEFLLRSYSLDRKYFLPQKELTIFYMRKARFFARQAIISAGKHLPPNLLKFLEKIVQFVDEVVGPELKVGELSKDVRWDE